MKHFDSDIHNNYKDFLNLLISGDRIRSSEFVFEFLNCGNSIQVLYEDILKSALYDIGELWESKNISIATEHLASAIVETLMYELSSKIISKTKNNKNVIVTCLENEYHQIGVKMVSHIFELNGWNSHFLGANTPTTDLISFVRTIQPDLLALSISMYFHMPELEKTIQLMRNEFHYLTILIGGQAFLHGGQDMVMKYENVIYMPDLFSMDSFIRSFDQTL